MKDNKIICAAQRGRAYKGLPQRLEPAPVKGKTNCLTTVGKDNLIIQLPRGYNKGGEFIRKSPTLASNAWQHNNMVMQKKQIRQLNQSKESGGRQPYQQNRVYSIKGQAPALMNGHGGRTINILAKGTRIRRLTPSECAKLQTVPDWYKWDVSETQQYKMLGNGWTVEVIKHILSFLPFAVENANYNER